MIKNIINCNITFLQKYGVKMETEDDKDVYRYGLQVLYSYFINVSVLLLIALCYGRIYETVIMILIFAILQIFGGGYHAKTKTKCLTIMALGSISGNLLINLVITKSVFMILSAIFVAISIILLVPAANKNHPITKKTYTRSKRLARIITCCIFIAILGFVYFGKNAESSTITITLWLYFVSLATAKLFTHKKMSEKFRKE